MDNDRPNIRCVNAYINNFHLYDKTHDAQTTGNARSLSKIVGQGTRKAGGPRRKEPGKNEERRRSGSSEMCRTPTRKSSCTWDHFSYDGCLNSVPGATLLVRCSDEEDKSIMKRKGVGQEWCGSDLAASACRTSERARRLCQRLAVDSSTDFLLSVSSNKTIKARRAVVVKAASSASRRRYLLRPCLLLKPDGEAERR